MGRQMYNMNLDWRFHDGDIKAHNQDSVHERFIRPEWVKAGNHGLAQARFDDSTWDLVNLPHDFVNDRGVYDDTTPSCTGSYECGIGWYRKSFHIDEGDVGQRFFLQFDGVNRDCEVWVNGCLAGRHLGGYIGFDMEITELLKYGSPNSMAVKVDATEYEGWWYEGGGIYRDVRLLKTQQLRLVGKELYVRAKNIDLQKKCADVYVSGMLDIGHISTIDKKFEVSACVISPSGQKVYETELGMDFESMTDYETIDFDFKCHLEGVDLWDLEACAMYEVVVQISTAACDVSSMIYDQVSSMFGIREIAYSAKSGFELNGSTVKLKGVCGHDDFAGVGVALTRPIIEYKIDQLMSMGCNAYRCAHNPPPEEFLELCDQKGMLVIDETRMPGVDYDNMTDYIEMIKRDRNHPSVICWSMGNEEMAIHRTEVGVRIFTKMEAVGKKYDATRPYLYAINADYDNIIAFDRDMGMVQDVVGLNYFVPHDDDIYATMHERYPDMCMLNTETTGICSTRAYMLPEDDRNLVTDQGAKLTVWQMEEFTNKVTCYGSSGPCWGMTPEVSWKVHADRPYSAGVFLWTGFDYRGEVFPFDYPATISFYGLLDLCGFPKDWYYYMKANWTNEDVLHLLPHWNMEIEEGTEVEVWAFTNCDQVELFLNGESVGKKVCEQYGHIEWRLPYNKGVIKAVGYRDGIAVMEDEKVTAGPAEKLVMIPNKSVITADNIDAVIVNVHLEDAQGNMVMSSGELIEFEFDGVCEFLGTGNGDHLGSERDKDPKRTLFAGRCITIAKSTFAAGEFTIRGKWNDKISEITLESVAPTDNKRILELMKAPDLGVLAGEGQREKAFADDGI